MSTISTTGSQQGVKAYQNTINSIFDYLVAKLKEFNSLGFLDAPLFRDHGLDFEKEINFEDKENVVKQYLDILNENHLYQICNQLNLVYRIYEHEVYLIYIDGIANIDCFISGKLDPSMNTHKYCQFYEAIAQWFLKPYEH